MNISKKNNPSKHDYFHMGIRAHITWLTYYVNRRDTKSFVEQMVLFLWFQERSISEILPTWEYDIMATNKSFQSWTFVNINLTVEQRTHFLQWADGLSQDTITVLTSVLSNGYKLSITYDTEHGTVISSLSCRDKVSSNFQSVLTARHMEVELSLLLVLYKHLVIADGSDWKTVSEVENWG